MMAEFVSSTITRRTRSASATRARPTRLLALQSLLEPLHVLGHLPFRLSIDDEREKKLPDAVTLKVEFDRHPRSIAAVHRLDSSLDIPTNPPVDASDRPRTGWVERSNLRRRWHFAGAGFPSHHDSLADLNWGVVVIDVDDTRLPLRHVRRVGHIRKESAGVREISTLSTMVVIACLLFSGRPDDVASQDVAR